VATMVSFKFLVNIIIGEGMLQESGRAYQKLAFLLFNKDV
jgi:hypothetical protein